ncbi:MAG: hypothetical protein MUO23_12980 [Anaerolineales bacterium]|nr:hypothetical protein [Anaerolineales bacterium]
MRLPSLRGSVPEPSAREWAGPCAGLIHLSLGSLGVLLRRPDRAVVQEPLDLVKGYTLMSIWVARQCREPWAWIWDSLWETAASRTRPELDCS